MSDVCTVKHFLLTVSTHQVEACEGSATFVHRVCGRRRRANALASMERVPTTKWGWTKLCRPQGNGRPPPSNLKQYRLAGKASMRARPHQVIWPRVCQIPCEFFSSSCILRLKETWVRWLPVFVRRTYLICIVKQVLGRLLDDDDNAFIISLQLSRLSSLAKLSNFLFKTVNVFWTSWSRSFCV